MVKFGILNNSSMMNMMMIIILYILDPKYPFMEKNDPKLSSLLVVFHLSYLI